MASKMYCHLIYSHLVYLNEQVIKEINSMAIGYSAIVVIAHTNHLCKQNVLTSDLLIKSNK